MSLKSKIEKAKTIVMPVSGGVGRNIFFTAVIKNFKKVYPDKKLYIVPGYPEIFENNPRVARTYGLNPVQYAHLFEDSIFSNSESLILEVEPYRHPEYVNGNMHIVEAWCDLLEIPCEDKIPEIFLSLTETSFAKSFFDTILVKYNKPVILLQHSGGKAPDNNDKKELIMNQAIMHRRSLREKTVQDLVNLFEKDGYLVACIQMPNQFAPKGAERVTGPLRQLIALLPYASGVIAIDSFVQHASAALGIKSLVLWAGTSPERLGYEMHKNLRRNECPTPECHRPNSYAFDVKTTGVPWDCPYKDACTDYEAQVIYKAYKEMKGKEYLKTLKEFKKPDVEQVIDINEHTHKKGTSCPVHK